MLCLTGCVGGVCALANILGEELCRLVELFQNGQQKEAEALQQRLVGPNACVSGRDFVRQNGLVSNTCWPEMLNVYSYVLEITGKLKR